MKCLRHNQDKVSEQCAVAMDEMQQQATQSKVVHGVVAVVIIVLVILVVVRVVQ